MNNAIIEIFEGQQITIRPSDGYWNATEMCQRYGRQFNDFSRLKNAKAYVASLSAKTGIPVLELLQVKKGGNRPGVWVHRRVALKLAAWLNPDFEVWVFEVIERLLTQGKVELQESFDALLDALDISEDQVRELLDRADQLNLNLSILGDNYAIDDNARTSEEAAWQRVRQLEGRLRELGEEL